MKNSVKRDQFKPEQLQHMVIATMLTYFERTIMHQKYHCKGQMNTYLSVDSIIPN